MDANKPGKKNNMIRRLIKDGVVDNDATCAQRIRKATGVRGEGYPACAPGAKFKFYYINKKGTDF